MAFLVSLFVTVLLVIGTSKRARVYRRSGDSENYRAHGIHRSRLPGGKQRQLRAHAAQWLGHAVFRRRRARRGASIFFAYVGFDAVSTAAEETKNPNRNIPIGLIGSLASARVLPAGGLRRGRRRGRAAGGSLSYPRNRWHSSCANRLPAVGDG